MFSLFEKNFIANLHIVQGTQGLITMCSLENKPALPSQANLSSHGGLREWQKLSLGPTLQPRK